MINDKNTNPKRDLYYLGGVVINVLRQGNSRVNFFDAFEEVRKRERISINLFSLTLDWLYLLGLVELNHGVLVRCF